MAESDAPPKNPTIGWMRSELERRGKQVRGQPFTKAQLVALLRATGVEVEDIDVTNQRDVVER